MWHCNNKLVMSILARSLLLLLLAMPSLVWGAEDLHLRNPIVHSVDDHSFHNNLFTGKLSLSLSLSLSPSHCLLFQEFSISSLSVPSILQVFFIPLPFVCKSDPSSSPFHCLLFASLIQAFFIPLPFCFQV